MLTFRATVDLEAMAMEGYSAFSQSSSIIGTSPSDYLVSYPGHLWRFLPLCRDVVGVFYSPILLGKETSRVSIYIYLYRYGAKKEIILKRFFRLISPIFEKKDKIKNVMNLNFHFKLYYSSSIIQVLSKINIQPNIG